MVLSTAVTRHDPIPLRPAQLNAVWAVIDVKLFRRELAERDFLRFMANPVASIDWLIPLFDKLILYGYTALAWRIAQEVYKPVKESPELIGDAASGFGAAAFMLVWQSVYERLVQGQPVDRDEIKTALQGFDYQVDDVYEEMLRILSGEETLDDVLQRDSSRYLRVLNLLFCRYMLDQKQVNFAAADLMWYGAMECIRPGKPDNSKGSPQKPLDEFLKLRHQRLVEYVTGRLSFLSNQRPNAFGVLWGIPYVYDFLLAQGAVSQRIHQAALDTAQTLKEQIIRENISALWQYDFVHSWSRPDSIDPDLFKEEAELFRRTFTENVKLPPRSPKISLDSQGGRGKARYGGRRKISRNDPCPCGSGKKYKKCCLNRNR